MKMLKDTIDMQLPTHELVENRGERAETRIAAARPSAPHGSSDTLLTGEILTVAEAARLLQLSPRTVERFVAESAIPFFRLRRGTRGSVRFLRSQLLRWAERLTIKPSTLGR